MFIGSSYAVRLAYEGCQYLKLVELDVIAQTALRALLRHIRRASHVG